MWKLCRLWIVDAIISLFLFFFVPISLFATKDVSVSIMPDAILVVFGYVIYCFRCVFLQDQQRGVSAVFDLMRGATTECICTVQQIQANHSRFSVSRDSNKPTFRNYFEVCGVSSLNEAIVLVTSQQLHINVNSTYRITYLTKSKIILHITYLP